MKYEILDYHEYKLHIIIGNIKFFKDILKNIELNKIIEFEENQYDELMNTDYVAKSINGLTSYSKNDKNFLVWIDEKLTTINSVLNLNFQTYQIINILSYSEIHRITNKVNLIFNLQKFLYEKLNVSIKAENNG